MMMSGSGFLVYDIYRIRRDLALTLEADERLRSSQSYRSFTEAMDEVKAAESDLAAGKAADFSESRSRVLEAQAKRDRYLREILDRDLLRFDPFAEGRPLPPGIEKSRAKLLAHLDERRARGATKLRKLGRLGGVGLVVGGAVVVFLTITESHSNLEPSAAYDHLNEAQRADLAIQLIHRNGPTEALSIEDILDRKTP